MINVITVTKLAIMRAIVEVIAKNVVPGHAPPVIGTPVAVILVQGVDLLKRDAVVTVVVALLEVKDAGVTVAVAIVITVAVVGKTHVTKNDAMIKIGSVHQPPIGVSL